MKRRNLHDGSRSAWVVWPVLAIMATLHAGEGASNRPLDAVLERPEEWRIMAPGRVKVAVDDKHTHGTPKALHLTWAKDLGDIAGTGVPTTPQVPGCWIKLPDDLDLSKFTRLSFWAKIEGARHGHLHVSFSNQRRLWGKNVKRHANNTPLDAGDWARYLVTIGHIDAAERKTYGWMGISSINVGHEPDESPVLEVWLDDFVLTSKPLRKTEGWEADPTVVIVSRLGFRPHHEKSAVVNGAIETEEFTIRNASDGREVFRGRLAKVTSAVGSYKVADFTRLTQPGRYIVEAGGLKSQPFSIGDDACRPCIELVSDWLFNMRCGCKTGLHAPCHLDDATFVLYEGEGKNRKEVSRRHLDVVGGWHDAGDVRTYYAHTYAMAHQCLRARECGWRRDRDGDGVDDLMDSALWAMRHLPKVCSPVDGHLLFKIEDWPDYRRGNYWTDCKIGTPDDRHIMDKPESVDSVGRACASAGMLARRAGPEHRAVADAALKVAEQRWAVWFDPEKGKMHWREKPVHVHGHGYHIAKWGQGSLQLYLVTRKPIYLEFARHCADRIMSYQRRIFYPGGPKPMCGEIFSWLRVLPDRDLPEEYLADLMMELPQNPDYYRWRATLVRAANWWMKPVRSFWRPFIVPHLEVPYDSFKEGFVGVPLQTTSTGKTFRYLVPAAGFRQLGDTAYGIQSVARALNDIELDRLARRQTDWAVGFNPFGVSWICGFGGDCIDQFYSFSQGRMPGCVSGFGLYNDGVPRCVRPYGGEPSVSRGMRLMRAMIASTEPARVRLTLHDGGKPWNGRVQVKWTVTGKTVFEGRSDDNGVVPEFKLDGGQRYDLVCGGLTLPFPVVSGKTYERTVDLSSVVVLSAEAPESVKTARPFEISLKVCNLGRKPTRTKITVYAEDAQTDTPARTINLGAGETKTIPWAFTAGKAHRPYVVLFEADGDHASILDVTGAIIK